MYANRARNIKNKAIKNEEMSTDVVWLQAQVLKLRAELRAIKSASPTLSDGTLLSYLLTITTVE